VLIRKPRSNIPLTFTDLPGNSGQSPARSPHRPVRAQFTHTVPQVVDSLHTRVHHPRVWWRMSLEYFLETLYCYVLPAATSHEPLSPDRFHPTVKDTQAPCIASDAIISVVPIKLLRKDTSLIPERPMPIASAPLCNFLQRPHEATCFCLLLHYT
jgi:hypothetical protein